VEAWLPLPVWPEFLAERIIDLPGSGCQNSWFEGFVLVIMGTNGCCLMKKMSLSKVLIRRGLAQDEHAATALVLAGAVLVDEQRIDKPGSLVSPEARIRIKSRSGKYVSRGGLKLEAALNRFKIEVSEKACVDLGASTGGFTDCLLQHGASVVYAFDVGRGQLDWKLQQDPRVIRRDAVNVRYLEPDSLDREPDLVTIDLSFISLRKVLPAVRRLKPAQVVALVKPQFEADREEVEKGGIISDGSVRQQILERVKKFANETGWQVLGCISSPIRGQKGNEEYLLWLCPSRCEAVNRTEVRP
jgi:23S rRNA (cytidine1920-2'-O)/16S rRNA (cytidine1409-2'-O)-methyltransferase